MKRAPGTGSIKHKGRRWVYYLPRVDGGPQKMHGETWATRKEAEAGAALVLRQLETGTYLEPNKATVGQMADAWYAALTARTEARTTHRAYGNVVRHIKAHLGDIPAGKLTMFHVEAMRDGLLTVPLQHRRGAETVLAPRYVRDILSTLSTVMEWALDHDLVGRNVAKRVTMPEVQQAEKRSLTRSQAIDMWAACERAGAPYGTTLRAGMLTCSRVLSMMGGLMWDDWDEATESLTVGRHIWRDVVKQMAERPENKKNHIRVLDMRGTPFKAILREQRLWQAERASGLREAGARLPNGKVAGDGYVWRGAEFGLIFPNEYGEPMPTTSLRGALLRILDDAGLPAMTPHEVCRHTGVSLLNSMGVPDGRICSIGGWRSEAVMRDTYRHVFAEDVNEALRGLGALLEGAR